VLLVYEFCKEASHGGSILFYKPPGTTCTRAELCSASQESEVNCDVVKHWRILVRVSSTNTG